MALRFHVRGISPQHLELHQYGFFLQGNRNDRVAESVDVHRYVGFFLDSNEGIYGFRNFGEVFSRCSTLIDRITGIIAGRSHFRAEPVLGSTAQAQGMLVEEHPERLRSRTRAIHSPCLPAIPDGGRSLKEYAFGNYRS